MANLVFAAVEFVRGAVSADVRRSTIDGRGNPPVKSKLQGINTKSELHPTLCEATFYWVLAFPFFPNQDLGAISLSATNLPRHQR